MKFRCKRFGPRLRPPRRPPDIRYRPLLEKKKFKFPQRIQHLHQPQMFLYNHHLIIPLYLQTLYRLSTQAREWQGSHYHHQNHPLRLTNVPVRNPRTHFRGRNTLRNRRLLCHHFRLARCTHHHLHAYRHTESTWQNLPLYPQVIQILQNLQESILRLLPQRSDLKNFWRWKRVLDNFIKSFIFSFIRVDRKEKSKP